MTMSYFAPTIAKEIDVGLDEFSTDDIRKYLQNLGDKPINPHADFERDIERVYRALADGDIAEAVDILRRTFKFLRPFENERRIAQGHQSTQKAISHVQHHA